MYILLQSEASLVTDEDSSITRKCLEVCFGLSPSILLKHNNQMET